MLGPVLLLQALTAMPPPPMDHHNQFGLSLAPGVGYRVIFPYNDGEFCGDLKDNGQPKRVCTARLPWFLELEVAFGILSRLDLIADFRFGLEQDFNTSHIFFFAPGIKYFIDPEKAFKLYATFQIVFDDESQMNPNVNDFDFALRNANGLQYELARYLGLYAQFGETLGFVRWLRFELDFAWGVQGRFP
ncbi:MAG TPA: hypothetical protein VKN99_25160 [Polyangia bacterium]|nr:hypothetical protein [Polyangia bacterium]